MSKNTILENWKAELEVANKWKTDGVCTVSAVVAGRENDVTIDEYIAHWEQGIAAMEAGAPQENYNY